MRKSLLIALSSALASLGCNDPPAPAAATRATASGTPKASAAPKKPAPTPKALDVQALQKALKCRPSSTGPCAVLAEFKDCIAFNPVTASGDGRWLGEGFVTKGGAFVPQFTVLRSRRVGTSEVAAGQLPAKIGVDRIPDDRGAEQRHARKALQAFRRGDIPTKTNQAVRYLKRRASWSESYVMPAEGHQIYVQTDGGTYLCARKDQRLMMVQRRSTTTMKGDGIYATLWPVTW